MEKLTWKEKHKMLLRNKVDIVKEFNNNIPVKKIAKKYELSISCINQNLKKWGLRKKHGIRHILSKLILEGD